jgi:sodium transport system permease protein
VREIFRDRRTLLAVIVSPLLITPALIGLVGGVIRRESAVQTTQTYVVGVVGGKAAPETMRWLRGSRSLVLEDVPRREAERRIRERELRAAIVLPTEADRMLGEHREMVVELLIDAGNEASQAAADRVREWLRDRARALVAVRLMDLGLSSQVVSPWTVRERPISAGGTRATLLLATMLPYIMVIGGIVGGVHAANDLVAGEKERGTLEALLVTAASRREIVLGKFMAVTLVSLVAGFLTLVGLIAPFFLRIPGLTWLADADVRLTASGIGSLLLAQLPLSVMGAGLLLAISTLARHQREAQSYLAPVMLAVSVLAMLSTVLRSEAHVALALAPVLNAAMAMKQALLGGSVDAAFAALAFTSSALYASLAMWLAVRLFERESVLLKT